MALTGDGGRLTSEEVDPLERRAGGDCRSETNSVVSTHLLLREAIPYLLADAQLTPEFA